MKKRLFPLLIALSALAVSGSAAFYSVFGLSKLFAGASTQVIIMAGSLEFAKLVVASLLYQYWDTINKWLRTYLAIACFILMIITSGGIYGFLSGAYQSTANQSELLDKSLMILNQKQVRFEESKEDLTIEKTQINKSISDLRISLSSPTSVSYWDKNSQTVITTSSSSARRALQAELKTTILDRDNINTKIESVMDSINKTDIALLDKEVSNEAESELGPLKYLAETTGQPMNQVVNWFLLLIIFVFDPLAIALVVAANMAFAQIRKPEDSNVPYEDSKVKTDLDDINDKPYSLEEMRQQEEIEREYFKDLQSYRHHTPVDIDENRMNIIGQNGNDGLHYNEEDIALDRLTDTTQTLIVDKQYTLDELKYFKRYSLDEIADKAMFGSQADVFGVHTNKKEEELIELSKEIGKKELADEEPIKPSEEDLEKLALALNISKKEEDDDKKLRYKGR